MHISDKMLSQRHSAYPFYCRPIEKLELAKNSCKKPRQSGLFKASGHMGSSLGGRKQRSSCGSIMMGKFNVFVCLWVIFLRSMEFSGLVPTFYAFSMSKDSGPFFFGVILAAFSAGSFLSSLVFNYLSHKSRQSSLFILSLLLGLFGGLFYTFASHKWLLLIGRVISGFGAGAEKIMKTFIIERMKWERRGNLSRNLHVCEAMGLVLGPALCGILSFFPEIVIPSPFGPLPVSPLNALGLLSSFAFFCAILAFLIFFHNPQFKPRYTEEESFTDIFAENSGNSGNYENDGDDEDEEILKLLADDEIERSEVTGEMNNNSSPLLGSFVIFVNLILFSSLFLYETIVVPFIQITYKWPILYISLFWVGVSLLSTLSFLLTSYSKKYLQETSVILISLILTTCSFSLMVSPPFILFGSPVTNTSLPSLISNHSYHNYLPSPEQVDPYPLPPKLLPSSLPLWRFLLGSVFLSFSFPFSISNLRSISMLLLVNEPYHKAFGLTVPLARIVGPLIGGVLGEISFSWGLVGGATGMGLLSLIFLMFYTKIRRKVEEALLAEEDGVYF